jgi:FkbM family methyltransferase
MNREKDLFPVKKRQLGEVEMYLDEGDTGAFESVGYYIRLGTEKECAMAAVKYAQKNDVCIVAGGCVGYFPLLLADHFKQVFTFEPDPTNFYCLVNNIPQPNVIKSQLGLGFKKQNLSMVVDHSFSGMNHIDPEAVDANAGNVRIIQLDDLELENCDMIIYDMEGFEYSALRGSEKTIKRCRPSLSVAFEGHYERYGTPSQEVFDYITKELLYTAVEKVHLDLVFVPNERL